MKKISSKEEKIVCELYENLTVKQIAEKYDVHSSTISRILKKHNKRVNLVVKRSGFDEPTKIALRKLLLGLGISNPNFVVSEMEKQFIIKLREEENSIPIFNVEEWI